MSELMSPKETSEASLKKRTRRSFVTWLGLSFLGVGGWLLARTRATELGIPWPFRRVLGFNEKVWRSYFSPKRLGASPEAPEEGSEPRVNGKVGLESEVEESEWRLLVSGLSLSIEDIKKLPRTEATCVFKCIEGWSEEMSYAGVKFSDFASHYNLGARFGKALSQAAETDFYPYVGLRTPDGNYYVSVDRESMWHSKTILAYEMNGEPISEENGAPLRLMIPVKYGIKNLKRVGSMVFADEKPPDYWHEKGYDWYAGL